MSLGSKNERGREGGKGGRNQDSCQAHEETQCEERGRLADQRMPAPVTTTSLVNTHAEDEAFHRGSFRGV